MRSRESRSYTDADLIWGWSERVKQWYESNPEPDEWAHWIFQPCREAEKALGNCEKHQAHIVQRHLDACESTFAEYVKHRDKTTWADFLRAADLLQDKLNWLTEKLQSSDSVRVNDNELPHESKPATIFTDLVTGLPAPTPDHSNVEEFGDVSHEQRKSLEALAVKIGELLRMCPGGRVSTEARHYCADNLLGGEFGSLSYSCNVFRRENPRTKQRIVHFPGTLAIEAIPYAMAIGSDGEFPQPSRAATLFKTDNWDGESLARLDAILKQLHTELREPILPASDVKCSSPSPALIVDAQLAADQIEQAVKAGQAADCIQVLSDSTATIFWKCLKRLGWWAPEQLATPHECISFWLFREDLQRLEIVEDEERRRPETPIDRASDAASQIESLVRQAIIPNAFCLNVYQNVCLWLRRVEKNELPLAHGGHQLGCPWEIELSVFRWCFDVEWISITLNRAAEKHGLATVPHRTAEEMMQAFNCHPVVAEKRAKDGIQDALRHYRSEWMQAVKAKGELVSGWEVSNSTLPWSPIKDANELREWLSCWLNTIHEARDSQKPWNTPEMYLEDVRRELRNSERLLEKLRIPLPTDFDDEPETINRAEKQLKLLIRCLTECATESTSSVEPNTIKDGAELGRAENGGRSSIGQPQSVPLSYQSLLDFRKHQTVHPLQRLVRDAVSSATADIVKSGEQGQDASGEAKGTAVVQAKEPFYRPPGTYTVLEFASALTDLNSSEKDLKDEARRLRRRIMKHWEGRTDTHKPLVHAIGKQEAEYFSLEDLFDIATSREIFFDKESVTARLAGTVSG